MEHALSGFAHDGRTWSAKTLFKLRNANELEAFFNAMNAFDALINRSKTYRFDWFSDRFVNEVTPYNTRYWFFDPTPGQQR